MKYTTVLLVVIATLSVASKVTSTSTSTKTEHEFKTIVHSKRRPLTQRWSEKELNTAVAIKDHKMATSTGNTSTSTPKNNSIPSNSSCPTWTYPIEDGSCVCGDTLNGAIQCNDPSHNPTIYGFYCMTFDNSTGKTVSGRAGTCVYNCTYIIETPYDFFHSLPDDASQLNTEMCGCLHRTGQLCGQCEEGYKQPAYFYSYECVTCDNTKYNWLKYITLAFVPLTCFLFIVFCFRISATSAPLNSFIFFSQIISAPVTVRELFNTNILHGQLKIVAQIGATLYGFWNLDFFRTVFPGICLDLSYLQILMLDYAIAFYPLLLMIVFYIFIELHDSNCRPIVCVWKPFNRCLSRFRRQWNARASTVDAFATFLLLSYVKVLSVSADILTATWVYDVQGNKVGLYLYYDATVEYFGREHLPYALVTVVVLFIFILFPLVLLIIYPMKCFQRCLGCSQLKLHAVHVFADVFQGCYKDGTNGTRDCRYFAAIYLIVRIILYIISVVIGCLVHLVWHSAVLFIFSILIAATRPYKPKYSIYSAIDTVLTLLLGTWVLSVMGITLTNFIANTDFLARKDTLFGLSFITGLLPLLYFFYLILHWLFYCIKPRNNCFPKKKKSLQRRASQDSLPDRMVNPDDYSLYDPVSA